MLSSKARYALRAVVELARADGAQITAGDLAERADAPRKFLEAILLELARRGVVVSRRGKLGGYSLARPAAEISFAEVIRVIDGPLAMAPCVSRLQFRKCDDCPDLATCSIREALLRARDATADVLEGYTLAEAAASGGGEVFGGAWGRFWFPTAAEGASLWRKRGEQTQCQSLRPPPRGRVRRCARWCSPA